MNNSENSSNGLPLPNGIPTSITLELRGCGMPIPFKNTKRVVTNRKTGKPFIMTRKDVKAWMEMAIEHFAYQLRSIAATTGGETQAECWRRFSTVWSALSDDSIREFPEGNWTTLRVPHGNEGVTITIELI